MMTAILIIVLLGVLDAMLVLACMELEKEQKERQRRRR